VTGDGRAPPHAAHASQIQIRIPQPYRVRCCPSAGA
jgi:hypothetical protein